MSTLYGYGLKWMLFMPLNDDNTIPVPERMIGGIGPFDFSGEANPAAIEFTSKIDAADEETVTIDLSGAVAIAAVTVAELFAAINTATPTNLTASADAVTGRIKLEQTDSEAIGVIQIYGAAGLIGMFGQGYGLKYIKTKTLKTLSDSPTQKDAETISTTDAEGLDTEVITDSYRKGFAANYVDSAENWELLALMDGGTVDPITGAYEVPTPSDVKAYFMADLYYTQYEAGTNKIGDLVGYVKKTFRSCVGGAGEATHERGFMDGNYTIVGTPYKDENDVTYGDTVKLPLTIEEYEALDIENL